MAEPANSGKPQAAQAEKPFDMFDCKYKWVNFQAKSNPTDPEDVRLGVQGFVVSVKRNTRVPIPEFFLDCADHAVFNKYDVQPGQGRKVVAKIRKFPYTVLGDATRKDFEKEFLEGTKKTRQAIAAHGLKIPVEQAVSQEDD